jgi:hypothetical protein
MTGGTNCWGKDSPYREEDDDDYSDLQGEFNVGESEGYIKTIEKVLKYARRYFRPLRFWLLLNTSARNAHRPQGKKIGNQFYREYTENDDENDDYSSIFW